MAVTAHRRENLGAGMTGIASALTRLAERPDVAIIYPLHPNPDVARVMRQALADEPDIALTDPLAYPDFVAMLMACDIVLTDSGGVQEEAPVLGKPVLVLRDTTERPEGIEAGTARLVGTDPQRIVTEASRLLDDPTAYAVMARGHDRHGDGRAAHRIAQIVADRCNHQGISRATTGHSRTPR